MKSYQQSLRYLTEEIDTLTGQLAFLKQTPPGLYRVKGYSSEDLLVITKQYRLYKNSYQNKIILTVIADEDADEDSDYFNVLPYNICLNFSSCVSRLYVLSPVAVKDLPLYIGWPFKSAIFEEILRTGKLPKSIRSSNENKRK